MFARSQFQWTLIHNHLLSRDSKLESPQELPDIYTSYRKLMEPLREKPRSTLPTPEEGSLPNPIDHAELEDQEDTFDVPLGYEELEAGLLEPLKTGQPEIPPFPEGAVSAHPFAGGEDSAQERLYNLVKSGHANTYKDTRNGLMGTEFSTKLSAYLAQGCITARQVHEALVALEDGTSDDFAETEGYGQGENEGTKAIRFELLWRDYMRLCTRKFKARLFYRSGFRDDHSSKWKSPKSNPDLALSSEPEPDSKNPESDSKAEDEGSEKETADSGDQTKSGSDESSNGKGNDDVAEILRRLFAGTTGMGLIDASQRELLHTGYTSNRARQNVASFLAKHLCVDWRWGAEWYESLLVDYDVSSNWANWQYVAGVGNDPRGEARIFNPVKQAFEYDPSGDYVRRWVPELRALDRLENLFQPWTTARDDWARLGLEGLEMAENPVKKIDFVVEGKPKSSRRPFHRRHGRGRGGSGSGGGGTSAGGQHHGQAPASGSSTAATQPPGSAALVAYGQSGTFVNYNGHVGNVRGGFRGGRGPGPRGRGNYSGGGRGYRGGGRVSTSHGHAHPQAHAAPGPWQHGYVLPHRPMPQQQQQWVPSFIPPPPHPHAHPHAHPHLNPHAHPHPHMIPHPHALPVHPPPPPPPQ